MAEAFAHYDDGCVVASSGPDRSEPAVTGEEEALRRSEARLKEALAAARALEAELRDSEKRFSTIFHANPASISISRLSDGKIIEINQSLEVNGGFSRAEIIGRTAEEMGIWVDPRDRARLVALLRENGVVRHFETRFRHKSGAVRDVLMWADAIDLAGERCLVTVSLDVSQQRTLEERYREAQKMETVGRLAGGIAHEFNNLLTVIGGYSDLLLKGFRPDDPSREAVQEIAGAAARAATLTRQLLAFGRKQVLRPRVVDVNGVVSGMRPILERLLGGHVEVDIRLQAALGRVSVDRGQLEQVVMNLAVNARDAMPRGGRLTFETRDVDARSAPPSGFPALPLGRYVMLAVKDTGAGMDAATMAHLFEPFFTTKEIGKGTGLGLATVFGIVKQSGGDIAAESAPGRGAAFTIILPRAAGEPDSLGEGDTAPPGEMLRGWTVMLVEKDEGNRRLTGAVLRSRGCEVIAVARPEDAPALAASHPGPIHALVSDVVLGGLIGSDLAARVAALRPGIRVLYMSGGSDDPIRNRRILAPGSVVLEKPFSPAALASKLGELLRMPGSPV